MSQRYHTSFAPGTTQPERNERDQIQTKVSKLNEANRYPAAHNGLVAGLMRAELATRSIASRTLLVTVPICRPNICHVPKS
ncbi:hypothetical protein [Bradyrhizobium sp. USDA 3256]